MEHTTADQVNGLWRNTGANKCLSKKERDQREAMCANLSSENTDSTTAGLKQQEISSWSVSFKIITALYFVL